MLVNLGMKQNKLILGLTGGSGCGKSIVALAAKDLGFVHIDTDIIAHNLILKPNYVYNKIIENFGKSILDENGEIDRKKLGLIVFSDKNKLKLLNSIIHPEIEKAVVSLLDDLTIIDAPVIYETPGIMKLCNKIIAVECSDERRIKFICQRDKISIEDAKRRISNQPSNEFYSNFSDITINSDCSAEELYSKSLKIIKEMLI